MFELNPEYTIETMQDDIATQKRLICFAVWNAEKGDKISPDTAATIVKRLDRITEIVNDYIKEH